MQALLSCSIADIECGNCKGLGAYDKLGATQAPSDEEYFSALQPYLPQGRIGMFLLAKLADRELVRRAADAGLHFLRVGANAGDGPGCRAGRLAGEGSGARLPLLAHEGLHSLPRRARAGGQNAAGRGR